MPLYDKKISILVVDDEPLILDLVQEILVNQGYDVILANSAKEALNILDGGATPDLIVSDINMQDTDGFEFYSQIQKSPDKNKLPFIFLSSLDDKSTIIQGKELGADDYLTKPFTNEDLLTSIREALKRAKELNASYNKQLASTKNKILNMLSHEFRTPLMTIMGFSQLLSEDSGKLTEPELKNFLGLILQSSKRLKILVEDFIQSSSIETGECEKLYHSARQKENITDLVERILKPYQKEGFDKKFSIKKNVPDELIFAYICSSQISTIIQKIIDNAIKFCYENSVIEVSINNKIDFAEISVKNDGVGIPINQKDKIFDKFYQVNRNTQEQQGSGLGLFIANSLATINKCTIEFESIEKSHTVFKIKIPIVQQ